MNFPLNYQGEVICVPWHGPWQTSHEGKKLKQYTNDLPLIGHSKFCMVPNIPLYLCQGGVLLSSVDVFALSFSLSFSSSLSPSLSFYTRGYLCLSLSLSRTISLSVVCLSCWLLYFAPVVLCVYFPPPIPTISPPLNSIAAAPTIHGQFLVNAFRSVPIEKCLIWRESTNKQKNNFAESLGGRACQNSSQVLLNLNNQTSNFKSQPAKQELNSSLQKKNSTLVCLHRDFRRVGRVGNTELSLSSKVFNCCLAVGWSKSDKSFWLMLLLLFHKKYSTLHLQSQSIVLQSSLISNRIKYSIFNLFRTECWLK